MTSALPKKNSQGRFFVASLLFPLGILLPILATIFVALQAGSPLPGGLWNAQRSTPWLWMVDVLPILLGLLGRFLSTPAGGGSRSSSMLLTLLILICLFPSGMMLYAWQEARGSVQTLRATRLAATLQTLTLKTYIQLNQKPGSNLHQEFTQMGQIRKEIRQNAPTSILAMEPAWQAFYREAVRSGKLSLETAMRMRNAAEKLTRTLEDEARSSRTETAEVLLVGVLGTLISLGLILQLFNQLRQLETQLLVSNKQQTATNKQLAAANSQLEDAHRRLESVHTQLEQTSSRDVLTSLHNRRALNERLEVEWNRAVRYHENLTVVLIDVDYFRSYNESFGIKAGDAVLQTIGAVLQHGVRTSDFAARHGGEEFLIILPHTSEEEAIRLAERLRSAIQVAPWKHRAVTVSVGVAERTSNMVQISDLMDAADVALYQAKKTRNRVCRSFGTASSSENKKAA